LHQLSGLETHTFFRLVEFVTATVCVLRRRFDTFSNRDPAARGTMRYRCYAMRIKTRAPGFISLLEITTGVTDKFIVSIGAGATADSSVVLFS
jgi:hypothetical protein